MGGAAWERAQGATEVLTSWKKTPQHVVALKGEGGGQGGPALTLCFCVSGWCIEDLGIAAVIWSFYLCIELNSPQIQVHPDPPNVPAFGGSVFADIVRQ